MKPSRHGTVSLERALSKLGILSRTQARKSILEGKVRIDGSLKTNPLFQVVPERIKIEIESQKAVKSVWQCYLLHKPRSFITSHSDELGRPTVYSLLNEKLKDDLTDQLNDNPLDKPDNRQSGLHSVGRLDWATSGLLLLTNDTRLSSWLTDPKNQVHRIYQVSVRGEFEIENIEKLKKGIVNQGELLKIDAIDVQKITGKESHLTVTLTEGKNREIRRIFATLGNEVTRLKRVSYGSIDLGTLQPGEFRVMPKEEIQKHFPSAPLNAALLKPSRQNL